ncbi:MAG: hypothetical protein ACI30A_01710 [Paludibacteraceae bacterium]
MIRIKSFLCMITALSVCCGVASAQYRRYNSGGDNYHFVYLSGSAGYAMLQNNVSSVTSRGNAGGLVGLGYEFRNSGFWISVGAQMSFHRSTLSVEEMEYLPSEDSRYAGATFYDTQGKEIYPRYRVTQEDKLRWAFVDVPIMLGYYVHGFYIGAGAKLSYALSPKVETAGAYDFSATYELYPEIGGDVGHGFGHYDYQATIQSIAMKPSCSIIGEIGYDLLSMVSTRSITCSVLKLGFYFECGVSPVVKATDGYSHYALTARTGDGYDLTRLQLNPYLPAVASGTGLIVPFYTGVKLTYMFGGSRTARAGFHKGCQCYNN